MQKLRLELIPEPAPNTATVLVLSEAQSGEHPYALFSGQSGDTNYLCGCCGAVLASGIERGALKSFVLKCLNCNSFNSLSGS